MQTPSHAALASSSHSPTQVPLHAQPLEQSMTSPPELLLDADEDDDPAVVPDDDPLEDDEGSTPVPLGESEVPPLPPFVVSPLDPPPVMLSPGSSESVQALPRTRKTPSEEEARRRIGGAYNMTSASPPPLATFATVDAWRRSVATSPAHAARSESSSGAAMSSIAAARPALRS